MRTMLLIALGITMVACDGQATPPKPNGCVEFDRPTVRKGKPVVCRMVWCEQSTFSTAGTFHSTGGAASLWCDEVEKP